METETIQFASADGRSVVDARLWMPSSVAPVAIVQLVHGMAEHIDRYADFARFLTEAGIGVCAENHIGHGATAPTAEELGHMPPDGKRILIADVHALRTSVQETYAGVPYFLFGHSMGSFITRAYLARHGEGLAGAVICGTGNQLLALSKAGHVLAMLLCHLKGADYRSPLLDSMGAGGFARAIENPRTPLDWISVDPAVVDAYLADEMCGQMFSVGAYATLTSLTGEVVTLECARRVPPQLPLLFIAGAQDPVGDCGKGVKAAADLARKAGSRDVRLTLYEGMRHEILNEPEKARVYQDVLAWLKEQM
ncbi:alpha/beta fold hydrolase [Parvibacter caecicola]|uniref:Alpha/beta hydrolase n=1 Tax=Parvibacter caecicola TaxID=747645 RepID=A0A4T9T663_9ACTN|nr:alpha/beta fold hydrolase [Parvibacter caecicola]TJW09736.1 alpha/beta hydrolase [Parvibacter caecicola]